MVVGFKGNEENLTKLYSKIGLVERRFQDLKEFETALKKNEIEPNTIIVNYGEIMKSINISADIIEKQAKILSILSKNKNTMYLGMNIVDEGLDKLKVDIAIEAKTSLDINKDSNLIVADYFEFVNTDKAFNDSISDDEYVVKTNDDERGIVLKVADIKKMIM